MPKIEPFERYLSQYEDWFEQNRFAFQSEIEAVRRHLPDRGRGIEIGVGSGLFAEQFGIRYGIEPSKKMRSKAAKRGVNVVEGVAEKLPFEDSFYDYALMVTTICFLDDIKKSINEAYRIVKPGGKLIIGLVDKNSPIGKLYKKFKQDNVFYRHATFYTTDEVVAFMKQTGFNDFYFTQTIFKNLDEIKEPEEVKKGYGTGSFVVVSGIKRNVKNGKNTNNL